MQQIQTWTATGIYTGGQRVSLNGFIWEAKWWNQNQNPETNSGGDGPASHWPMRLAGSEPESWHWACAGFKSNAVQPDVPQSQPVLHLPGLTGRAATVPAFAGTGDLAMRRREAAAAFANFAHETGGLVHVTEIARGLYCSNSATPSRVFARRDKTTMAAAPSS